MIQVESSSRQLSVLHWQRLYDGNETAFCCVIVSDTEESRQPKYANNSLPNKSLLIAWEALVEDVFDDSPDNTGGFLQGILQREVDLSLAQKNVPSH